MCLFCFFASSFYCFCVRLMLSSNHEVQPEKDHALLVGFRVDISLLGLLRRHHAVYKLRRVRAGLRPARRDHRRRQHSGALFVASFRAAFRQDQHPVRQPQTVYRGGHRNLRRRIYGRLRIRVAGEGLFRPVHHLSSHHPVRHGGIPQPRARARSRCQSRPLQEHGERSLQRGLRGADRGGDALFLRLHDV